MTVEGKNISGAPTLMPRIICSSLPSWLEWKTLISIFPLSAALALLAYSSVVIAKREPGKPTWPSLRVIVCARDAWTQRVARITTRTAIYLRIIVYAPFLSMCVQVVQTVVVEFELFERPLSAITGFLCAPR